MSSARRTALIFGVLYLATFVFSIAGVLLYDPVLHPAKFMAGAGGDTRVRLGAVCEVLLIIANIGTALVVYPIFRRQFEVLSLGYVTARLAECTFVAIGIVSYLAVVTLHQTTAGGAAGSLVNDARSLVAVRNWTFVLGPGFVAGLGERADPGLHDAPVRPHAARPGDIGAHRRLSHLHYGARGGARRIRQRRHGAGHRDSPGVHLGAIARDLSARQGVQGVSNPRGRRADSRVDEVL
jgi:Domain of unknown function (DUF4386)